MSKKVKCVLAGFALALAMLCGPIACNDDFDGMKSGGGAWGKNNDKILERAARSARDSK